MDLGEGSESTFKIDNYADQEAHTANRLLTVRAREHCRSGNDIGRESEEAGQQRVPTLAGVCLSSLLILSGTGPLSREIINLPTLC